MFRRKGTVALTAIALAALIITGTFAWTNFNATVLNQWQGEGAGVPGGTLHDDFCGDNKDVYVENWGSQPIYVRIRLDEYMELGEGAGIKSNPSSNKSTPLVGGNIDDTDTWLPHVPTGNDPTVDDTELRQYWKWNMGGSTYYFPAPNGNRDDQDYIDQNGVEDLGPFDQNSQGVYAKKTPEASVVTMLEWKSLGSPVGNYWVIDSAGWAYWASPVIPGDATGPLLNSVILYNEPAEDYYYGVNVIAQMATRDGSAENAADNYTRFGLEENGGWTEDGRALIESLVNSSAISGITITSGNPSEDDVIYAAPGDAVDIEGFAVTGTGSSAVTWTGSGSSSFSLASAIESARVNVSDSAVEGEVFLVTAISEQDPSVSKTVQIVLKQRESIVSANERIYVDFGNNTFVLLDENEEAGVLFSGGLDRLPGTDDDIYDLVEYNGVIYIEIANSEKVYSKGKDGLLGTEDDVVIGICGAVIPPIYATPTPHENPPASPTPGGPGGPTPGGASPTPGGPGGPTPGGASPTPGGPGGPTPGGASPTPGGPGGPTPGGASPTPAGPPPPTPRPASPTPPPPPEGTLCPSPPHFRSAGVGLAPPGVGPPGPPGVGLAPPGVGPPGPPGVGLAPPGVGPPGPPGVGLAPPGVGPPGPPGVGL
ncbi:MAG: hypothetical protein LBU32_00905, partial [Clostridiales bacterium]|nr:hypothetical protein [Clostridiales bacterium]